VEVKYSSLGRRRFYINSALSFYEQSFLPDIIKIMKVSLLCTAPLFSLATFAFPANLRNSDISEDTLAEITSLAAKITKDLETKQQGGIVKRGFNADAQRISTTGEHRYVRSPIKVKVAVCCNC
jgi:hypothetical protein